MSLVRNVAQTNGVANVAAIEAASQAGIPRFVFISAAIPNIPGLEYLLGGYVNGKRMAEEALQSHYPQGGVALRPGAIYGNRVISSSLTLPLQYVFQPLEALLAHLPSRQLSQLPLLGAALTPPLPVQAVARAAVKAATDSNVAPGILDVWDIQQY
ncbi:NAD(P)-bd_dom domain-containing protein, partial [Haematococcus lacustris]